MVSFRNSNNRRYRFRSNDRGFKRNNDTTKLKFKNESSNLNFQRKSIHRNNQNASKLVEKYTNLAREALANEDKILSENYYQYAEHFIRVLEDQKKQSIKVIDQSSENNKDETSKKENLDGDKSNVTNI